MEVIIGVVTAIVAKLAECAVVSTGRLFQYTSNVDNLTDRLQQLNNKKQNIQGQVDEATRNRDNIHDEVQNWLSSAGSISQTAGDFLNNYRDRANISCCNVRIPNLVSRRKLSREARQMIEDLEREIQVATFDDGISSRSALQSSIAIRGNYEHFESRNTILKEIMKALQDREVTKIGVYGMGGIGKIMLAKEVARRATEAKLFTEVAMTTLSQTPDICSLQQEIAEKIKFGKEISEVQSVRERADRLQHRLKEEKSILIILDDIWDELDLVEVGIHLENEGCKILMTSRDLHVLRSMGTDEKNNFQVADLSANEAMNLFKTIVGDIVEQSEFKRLATDVVSKCGGLPLAIRTVAHALKSYRSLSVWRTALKQLQNSAPTNIDGMLKHVYPKIRLSYDFLESDEEKSLLLLCSLYGEDRNIGVEELMMCSVGWSLFRDDHLTMADARMRVESLVVRLKACCLLLDGYRFDMVKMHDVIRDVALSIASAERGMHGIFISKLDYCMKKKKLKDSKVISLHLPHQNSNQLPERLECSRLELFFLFSSLSYSRLPIIPKHFLEETKVKLRPIKGMYKNLCVFCFQDKINCI